MGVQNVYQDARRADSYSKLEFPGTYYLAFRDLPRIISDQKRAGRPVENVIFCDEDYQMLYRQVGLELIGTHRPLGLPNEPFGWIDETEIAPWTIYVLKRD